MGAPPGGTSNPDGQTRMIDPLGRITDSVYDLAGRVTDFLTVVKGVSLTVCGGVAL